MADICEEQWENLAGVMNDAEKPVEALMIGLGECPVTDHLANIFHAVRNLLLIHGKVGSVKTVVAKTQPKADAEDRAKKAKLAQAFGYTGDMCKCGEFRIRRKGTCLQCDACGHSQGCS